MTGITPGLIMTAAGAAGIAGCLIGLLVTAVVFPKQRKKLLRAIETK